MKITITKIAIDSPIFVVTVEFPGGDKRKVAECATANEARAVACGVQFGANAVKTLIGLGPSFDGNIEVL